MDAFRKKYKELSYMQDISHTISTGNKKIDKAIVNGVSAGVNAFVKDPRLKAGLNVGLKIGKKIYPHIEDAGAFAAWVNTAYKESRKNSWILNVVIYTIAW